MMIYRYHYHHYHSSTVDAFKLSQPRNQKVGSAPTAAEFRDRLETHRRAFATLQSQGQRQELLGEGARKRCLEVERWGCCWLPCCFWDEDVWHVAVIFEFFYCKIFNYMRFSKTTGLTNPPFLHRKSGVLDVSCNTYPWPVQQLVKRKTYT